MARPAAHVDITDNSSVASLAAAIKREEHGRLDLLVNDAAILDVTAYDDLTIERFIEVHDVNLNGAVRVTMAMVPLMRKSNTHPSILNIASVNGLRGSRIPSPTRPPRAAWSISHAVLPASSRSTASG